MDRLPADLFHVADYATTPVRAHHAVPAQNMVLAAWRRSGLICGCVILSLGIGAGALTLMNKQYSAEAILRLSPDKREAVPADERGPAVVLDASAMVQGELKIIRSRPIARRVVERLHLDQEPLAPTRPGPPWLSGMLLSAWPAWWPAILHWAGLAPAAGNSVVDQPVIDRKRAAEDEIVGRMTAESDNRSYLVTIKFTASDPDRAAQVANGLAEEYVTQRLETNVTAAASTVEWLDSQIRQTTLQLQDAEATVQAYRAQSGLLELGSAETLDQRQLRDISNQRSAAALARTDAQSRLARIQEIVRGGAVPSVDDLKGSPQIRTLVDRQIETRSRLAIVLTDFGLQHPTAIQARAAAMAAEAALSAELRHAASIAQSDLAAAGATEAELDQRLEALQQAMISSKSAEAELRSRQAATRILRDRLAALTRSRDQAQAVQELRPVAAVLLVPAEPPRAPVAPKAIVVFPLALTGGLGFGVLLASFLERRDRGFQTGTEIEPVLGKRCLGMVPVVSRALRNQRGRRAAFERSVLSETVRSVGATLGLFGGRFRCRVLLVTSSVANEGKSVFCRALAETLVKSGRRVLLVDGAAQRRARTESATPKDFDEYGSTVDKSEPGLVLLHRSSAALLAADVFGKTEFTHLLAEARDVFDHIVIEGPPVMLVADSLVLGQLADLVIHVARWSSTKRSTVAAALARLQESSVSVEGVVLNGVNLARHASHRSEDVSAYYLKERRFYERLARQEAPFATQTLPEL